MSLEAAIAKLTAAVEEQNTLLRGGASAAATTTVTNPAPEADDGETRGGPGYWKTPDGSAFGAHANLKEYKAAEKQHGEIEEITKTEYLELKGAADKKAKAAADKKAKAAADKKAKAAADKKAKEEAAKQEADAGAEEEEHPSEQDLIDAFQKYLPKDLDKETRAERAPKVKAYLQEAGAKRATDLKPEQRADAIAFVEGLVAELDGGEADDDMI